jgi:hypothetical protein
MRVGALILLLVGGCNVVFGLEPADDDGTGGDAAIDGAGDDGGGDGDGGDVDGPPGTIPGTVWALNVDQTLDKVVQAGFEATALFGPPNTSCTLLYSENTCRVEACTPLNQQLPAPNAGLVTIEGDLRLVNLEPDGVGLYPTLSGIDGGFFGAGVTLGAYSAGTNGTGGVPAFSATLISPDPVSFSLGALPSQTSPTTILRATGLPLRWTAASRGTVTIIIAEPGSRRLTCYFPVTAELAEVPPTVLLQMPAGSASLWAYNVERTSTTAGDYEIQFVAAHAARRFDGAWARGTVTLQ